MHSQQTPSSPADTQSRRDPAAELAELVLSMGIVTMKGLVAARLAREVLGVAHLGQAPDMVVVTTNDTTRVIPRNEALFLVRGQDPLGGSTVRFWAEAAEAAGVSPFMVSMARTQAELMDDWPKKKALPDYPLFHE